jgi:hypothetical protein
MFSRLHRHFWLFAIWVLLALLPAGPTFAATPVVELDCHGAAPDGTSIHIEADLNAPAVLLAAWLPRDAEVATLTPAVADGKLQRSGTQITGRLRAKIARLSKDPKTPLKKGHAEVAVDLNIDTMIANGVLTGTWRSGTAQGLATGFLRDLPEPRHCTHGALAMVTAYPIENRVLSLGLNSFTYQLGAAFTLADGKVTGGQMQTGSVRPSWFPATTYTPAKWVDAAGRTVTFSGYGPTANYADTGKPRYSFTDTQIRGRLEGNTLTLQLVSTFRERRTTWDCTLQRAGALWYGTWTWNSPGLPEASAVAVARLGTEADWPVPKSAGSPRAILLRHALALAAHPSAAGWRDDLLTQAVKDNDNKSYDNSPNIVAGGILTGLLIDRLAEDPLQKAEGMAMARRAANWNRLARFGKLQIGEYYKGMFWITAWQGVAMTELARREPEGPWKSFCAEHAKLYCDQQLPIGTWTWVDEETGERGMSNERNDRTWDNRALNGGDILLALSRCSRIAGLDCSEAVRKAEAWHVREFGREQIAFSENKEDKAALAKLGKAGDVFAFYQDRRPGSSKDCWPSVSFFLYLAEQDYPDASAVATVRAAIEREFAEQKSGLLTGYYPRAMPDDQRQNTDLTGSARYALALAHLAAKGDASARRRSQEIIDAILAKASKSSGLIDHYGRDLPAAPDSLGRIDSHSYLCLKASLAWELADALDLLDRSTGAKPMKR